MGAFLSSSASKDAASTLSKTAKYLRRFLAALAIPSVFLIVIFGAALLITGFVIGIGTHWSGFLMGGVLFMACMAAAVIFWDLWGTVSLGLSMFELASCPKEELVRKLQKYNETNRLGQSRSVTSDNAIRNMCEGVADTILSKFRMAFQWTPLLFTALAAMCCMLTDVIENSPQELLIVSIVGVAVGLVASVCSITMLCCILTPIVEGQVKTAFDPYVEALQRKLAEDEIHVCVDQADTTPTCSKLQVAGQPEPLQVGNIV